MRLASSRLRLLSSTSCLSLSLRGSSSSFCIKKPPREFFSVARSYSTYCPIMSLSGAFAAVPLLLPSPRLKCSEEGETAAWRAWPLLVTRPSRRLVDASDLAKGAVGEVESAGVTCKGRLPFAFLLSLLLLAAVPVLTRRSRRSRSRSWKIALALSRFSFAILTCSGVTLLPSDEVD